MELTKAQIYEFVETFNASDSWQPLSAESVPNFGIIVNFKSGTQLRVNEIASNISVRIGRTILGQYVEYELQSPDMCAFIIRLVTEMCGAE
ncbi:hypothetical protein SDC9_148757 [bioreactor metagenome]|uniref:Uncharacterized protein n=1 Tax=bioreactor metagenome TaxID=1076179 RepID=A0A645EHQ9_9ZZZZ